MTTEKQQGFATQALHGSYRYDQTTKAQAVPIYQSVAYRFEDSDHAARLFSLEEPGNIYTRIMNPTNEVLEQRIALLEGGVGALAFASGHAAIHAAVSNIAASGDHIVSSSALYGGTYNLFKYTLPRQGVTVDFVSPDQPEAFAAAIKPETKLIFAEIIGNPKIDVLDIEKLAAIAHQHGLPLVVDATFVTPYLCKPLAFGADIVIHSATKFIGGHGVAMGGLVIDGGKFDWNNGKFPTLSEPDPSYHGVRPTEAFKEAAFIGRLRVQVLRDLGACISPFNSFLLLLGLETLALRMAKHSANAQQVAEFLAAHPKVAWVNYPGLVDSPYHELARKYLANGAGAMLTFGIKGGLAAGKTFIDALRLFGLEANVGDAKSLVIHPASTTHSQLTSEQRAAAGAPDDMIRLSVGIEETDDLLADLQAALAAV